MKVILITPPDSVAGEQDTIIGAFDQGLDILHVRKPSWGSDEIKKYLEMLPANLMEKVTLHSHFDIAREFSLGGIHLPSHVPVEEIMEWKGRKSRSAHSMKEIDEQKKKFDYFFLSPVFDSISKEGYHSNFSLDELKVALHRPRKHEIIALGGIQESNISEALSAGFDGIAVLGGVWQYEKAGERIQSLAKMIEKCRQITGTY